jgi:MFS family permease
VVAASVAFGGMLFVLIFGLYLTVLPLLLEDRFGLGAGARGFVLAAPAVASTTVALNLSRLRARFGARRLVLASSVTFAVSALTIGLAPSLIVLLLGALVYGLGEGAAIPTVQDLVAGSAPSASRGAVVAAWVGSARLGQTIGPLLAGAAVTLVGTGGTFVAGAALALALVAAQLVVRIDTAVPAGAPGGVGDGDGAVPRPDRSAP